jgi:hypothetical protein
MPYHEVLEKPKAIGNQLAQFLGTALDVDAMARQVDASLYRNRAK